MSTPAMPDRAATREAWLLLGFAAWNLYVWVTFLINTYPLHHWDAFFVVHLVIAVVTIALGTGMVGTIGLRALRRGRRASGGDGAGLG